MNLKAIKPSYGDFGRVPRGLIIKDVAKDKAEKLIASGAYVAATAADLKADDDRKAALAETAARRARRKSGSGALREDGPTVAEFVARGYLASNYPPEGYASRSSDEEIAEAVAAEAAKAELEKLTNKQLQELAKQEDIAVEGDDNKATLVSKILAGRAAKA